MRELIDLLARWRSEVVFPGRVRVFAAVGGAELAAHCDEGIEWEGAPPGTVLAAACGAAWAERERGGRVVAVIPGAALEERGCREASDLALAMQLGNLLVILAGMPIRRGWEGTGGFAWSQFPDDLGPESFDLDAAGRPVRLRHDPDRAARLTAEQPSEWRVELATAEPSARLIAQAWTAPLPQPMQRRAWPPVRLATLIASPPEAIGHDPAAAARTWLADISVREPRLLLVDPQVRALRLVEDEWGPRRPNAAMLISLAALSAEGRRVVWELPGDVDLLAWLPALAEIGRRGYALKLVIPASALPAATLWHLLPGWWVFAPADAAETVAVLAHALDSEEPVLVAVPDAPAAALPAWCGGYEPGTGRWLAGDGSAARTVLCDQRTRDATLDALTALAAIGVAPDILHLTSQAPLPMAAIEAAAARGRVLIADHPASQLGRAVRAELPDGVRVQVLDGVQPPQAADIAQAVRALG